MTTEASFQSYFLKAVPHGYRTALTTGGGFPDVLLIHGDRHSLVELKILNIGPSGNKKIAPLFKRTQPPWYWNYLSKGGTRLFVLIRLGGTHDGYGLIHIGEDFLRALDTITYRDLRSGFFKYEESAHLRRLLDGHFSN